MIRRPRRSVRKRVYLEQGRKCGKCARLVRFQDTELHHMKPVAEGGGNERGNLSAWCRDCHREETRYQNTDPAIREPKRAWRAFMKQEELWIFGKGAV